MRKSLAVVAAAVITTVGLMAGVVAQQAGALSGTAQGSDRNPLRNYAVQVRNASDGRLAGTTLSDGAGQFAFSDLSPGNYVVEILDATGKIVGLSPSITVAAGQTVTVTVSASAAGAISKAAGGGFSLLGLGPLASVAVAGAATAAAVTAVVATRDGKIVICHVQGNARQTIEVSENARAAHLGHGDTLGACPPSPSR
jgi:hypothetical protein